MAALSVRRLSTFSIRNLDSEVVIITQLQPDYILLRHNVENRTFAYEASFELFGLRKI